MIETKRWVNPSQPQLLQVTVFLLYFTGVFALIGAMSLSSADGYVVVAVAGRFLEREGLARVALLALAAVSVIAGNNIANERKIGYTLGLVAAIFPLACRLYTGFRFDVGLFEEPISLMFDVALVALLFHPQSREYQRIWFK